MLLNSVIQHGCNQLYCVETAPPASHSTFVAPPVATAAATTTEQCPVLVSQLRKQLEKQQQQRSR
jgi:hypothetical protein